MELKVIKKIPAKPTNDTPPNTLFAAKTGNTVKYGINLNGVIYELSAIITSSAPSSGGSGGTTDHGVLTGLADDDHVQYLLIDGSRAMTGALTLSGLPTADLHAAGKGYIDQTAKRFAILFG